MRVLLAVCFVLLFSVPALAAFQGPGTSAGVTTVQQALTAADGTPCVLEGNIVEKVTGRDEKYMFRDATGTIMVDIDDKVFAGKDATPATKVRLSGKVDTSKKKGNKVDVKQLEIL